MIEGLKLFTTLPAAVVNMAAVKLNHKPFLIVICANGRTYKVNGKGRVKRVRI